MRAQMAESTSPALPGDVEWLPGPGGARVVRIHPATSEPPALALRLSGGGERHLSAAPGAATEYVIPADLDWTAAWLQWPDGTRAALPLPHGRHAEVIQLHPRRFAREPNAGVTPPGETVAPVEPAASVDSAPGKAAVPAAPAPPGEAASPEPPSAVDDAPAWTTPPQLSDSTQEAEAVWRERRDDLRRELAEAADAIARARDGERAARDSVLTALAAARADLRASRAAREADASLLSAVSGELEVERAAHAVTRGSVGTLADALAAARAELAVSKTRAEATARELEGARAELAAARATSAAELADAHREATQARAEVASLRQALEHERPAPAKADLARFAREQADAAAAAARRPPDEAARLLANLDAAAAALRASAPESDVAAPREAEPGRVTPLERADGEDAAATARAAPPARRRSGAAEESLGAASPEPGDAAAPGAAEESLGAASPEPATRSTALVAASADMRLRRALDRPRS